jgi:hypothetical protein
MTWQCGKIAQNIPIVTHTIEEDQEPMALPKEWKPRPLPDLIRLGSPNDGGYVVPERVIGATNTLISLGICDDWGFERAFTARNPAVRIIGYDSSITTRFWLKRVASHLFAGTLGGQPRRLARILDYARFRRFYGASGRQVHLRNVGYARAGDLTLHSILGGVTHGAIFLKVDIERWEYRILDQILDYSSRLTGISFEFHDVDLMRPRISSFLAAMSEHFVVCWLHGNNGGGIDDAGDPLCVELTLVRKSYCTTEELQSANSPRESGLDAPNIPALPEILLEWAP